METEDCSYTDKRRAKIQKKIKQFLKRPSLDEFVVGGDLGITVCDTRKPKGGVFQKGNKRFFKKIKSDEKWEGNTHQRFNEFPGRYVPHHLM